MGARRLLGGLSSSISCYDLQTYELRSIVAVSPKDMCFIGALQGATIQSLHMFSVLGAPAPPQWYTPHGILSPNASKVPTVTGRPLRSPSSKLSPFLMPHRPPNASKLPRVTGMKHLEVAIFVTVVVLDGCTPPSS